MFHDSFISLNFDWCLSNASCVNNMIKRFNQIFAQLSLTNVVLFSIVLVAFHCITLFLIHSIVLNRIMYLVGLSGALVESTPFARNATGSNPALAAT